MIIYFSGTGNSLQVAQTLAKELGERLYNMEAGRTDMPCLKEDEPLGIVFPVYGWGLPKLVKKFLHGWDIPRNCYVWTVMTCGDDMGYTDQVLAKALGRKVDAAFSVQMPNTYVCLPGFDVDSQKLASQKVSNTQRELPLITKKIKESVSTREVVRGATPWVKSYVLRPLFNFALVTSRFFKVGDGCNGCGTCAKHCPTKDIVMVAKTPFWKDSNCTGCLRCYHNCPKRAIDWGRFTEGKGQKGTGG